MVISWLEVIDFYFPSKYIFLQPSIIGTMSSIFFFLVLSVFFFEIISTSWLSIPLNDVPFFYKQVTTLKADNWYFYSVKNSDISKRLYSNISLNKSQPLPPSFPQVCLSFLWNQSTLLSSFLGILQGHSSSVLCFSEFCEGSFLQMAIRIEKFHSFLWFNIKIGSS